VVTGPNSIRSLVVILGLATACPSFGQTFGLKLAYPTRDAFQISGSNVNPSYSFHQVPAKFGLTGELGLPAGLLLEIDGLYSHMTYTTTVAGVDATARTSTSVNAWDFPVLIKKEVSHFRIKPFVNGGAAFRAVNADTELQTIVLPNNITSENRVPTLEFIHQATIGFAAGVGLDFKIGKYHVVPEFRYMRFQSANFRSPDGRFQSNLTQPMIMLGLQRGR
jgi:opacity protein-like surface antigen